MSGKFQLRAATAFDRASDEIQTDINSMLAKQAADGQSGSGGTIRKALRIFEERSAERLRQTLEEIAKLVEHRGRAWNTAMSEIGAALEAHLANGPQLVDKARRVADSRRTGSVSSAIEEHLAAAGRRLRDQLTEFREGWTAPVPPKWKDRQPAAYAVSLLVLGAIIAEAAQALIARFL